MNPKTTEDRPLKKTEKEQRRTDKLLKDLKKRKIFYVSNRELTERLKKYAQTVKELKESLKKQKPGRIS